MTPQEREALVARIRKLSRFTTASGCTEHEANAALAKVRELIAAHNVTQSELEVRFEAARCVTDDFTELNSTIGDWAQCAVEIAALYGTRAWCSRGNEDALGLGFTCAVTKVKFFGLMADVAASVATAGIVCSAVSHEAARYSGGGRNGRASFRAGMIARLRQRLRDMKGEERKVAASGTALIVLKDQLVTEEYAKLNLRLRTRYAGRPTAHNSAAYAAGGAAGSRVDLGGGKITAQRSIASGR
jgi:hypothetical protein